jgi:quercetin dioxygenase-like cupin family protein
MKKLILVSTISILLSSSIFAASNSKSVDVYGGIPPVSIEKMTFVELKKGLSRASVHGDMGSFGLFKAKKGVHIPSHFHLSESLIYVHSGKVKFYIGEGDKTVEYIVNAGETVLIKSNVPHGADTLEDSFFTISSSPVRKDWVNKTDSQLRQ